MIKKTIIIFLIILMFILVYTQWRYYLENRNVNVVNFNFERFKGLVINDGVNDLQVDNASYLVYNLLKGYTMTPRFTKMPKSNRFSEFEYLITYWVDNDHWIVLLSDEMNVIYKNYDWYIITNGLELKRELEEILD